MRKDFSRVRVGSEAAITTSARPDLCAAASATSIRRSAPTHELRRCGSRCQTPVASCGSGCTRMSWPERLARRLLEVPRNAVQNVGDRTVVYLANPKEPGRFIEREVRLGQTSGEQVEVVSGVQPGDVVVTEGSFFVRPSASVLVSGRRQARRMRAQRQHHRATDAATRPSRLRRWS